MKNGSCIAAFVIGAAAGSLVTWHIAKKKYERIAQEEIDSVKVIFKSHKEDRGQHRLTHPVDHDEEIVDGKGVLDYLEKVKESGYAGYPDREKEAVDDMDKVERPYVIRPEEFGEYDDYEKISLTYYADGVLADDGDEPVEDVDEIVGIESLEHFGEYEDDSVFVRNDRLRCDYEILLDHSSYTEVSH